MEQLLQFILQLHKEGSTDHVIREHKVTVFGQFQQLVLDEVEGVDGLAEVTVEIFFL